jgi:hypothetical protein
VPREKEGQSIESMPKGTQVYHGYHKMDQGQRHFMSTATTYNVHTSPKRPGQTGGVMGVTGTSGRYVNPFGVMSTMTDGAEILYPPRTITKYKGSTHDDPKGIPLHQFTETSGQDVVPPTLYEDMNYKEINNPFYLGPPKEGKRLDYAQGTPYDSSSYDITQSSGMRRRKPFHTD